MFVPCGRAIDSILLLCNAPKFAYAYYGVGHVLYDQKKLEEALKSYRRAIELDPKLALHSCGMLSANSQRKFSYDLS